MSLPVIHLDRPNQAAFTGWSGEAINYAGLPVASAVDGEFWMVLNPSGSRFLLNYKASGLYLSESGAWRKINNAQLLLNDAQFSVYNTADNTKQIAFDVSAITTATKRTATWPNKDGVVAMVSDIITSHNSLSGLQGGTATEYYHLTLAELGKVQAIEQVYTLAEKNKLSGIEAGAEVNTISSVVAGTNVSIDFTNPLLPIISSTGGSTRNNYVLVKSKADLPTPIGGVITLADNFNYELNGQIVLGTDYIEAGVSNVIYGIDKSDDGLVYTGTGGAIRSTDEDLSIRNCYVVASTVGGKGFDLIGSVGLTKRIEIAECIFNSCDKIGDISSGFETVTFRNNLEVNCANGVEFSNDINDLFVTDNVCEDFTGTATLLKFNAGTYHTIYIHRNMFESAVGQTILDIPLTVTVTDGGLIMANSFEGGGTVLSGINANSTGWLIPYKTNVNLAGLYDQILNWGADGAFGTTSTVDLSPIITTRSLIDYGDGITSIDCILTASVTHQQSGNTVRIEINDVTNGNVAVVGSAVDVLIPVANVYQNVSTPEVSLNPNNEYNIKVTRVTGTGNNLAGARSATWEIKAF